MIVHYQHKDKDKDKRNAFIVDKMTEFYTNFEKEYTAYSHIIQSSSTHYSLHVLIEKTQDIYNVTKLKTYTKIFNGEFPNVFEALEYFTDELKYIFSNKDETFKFFQNIFKKDLMFLKKVNRLTILNNLIDE